MGIIEYHQGCGDAFGCFGPHDPYYAIFNTPLWYAHVPAGFALLGAAVVLGILYLLRRFGKIQWSNLTLALVTLVVFLIIFSLLASMTWITY